ncbi:MAG TPA: hypothetical protein VLE02_02805, partial [Nitrosarchaeum sp.]|nr:hypothetical protein [Nitrosarchaeum sp.]
LIQTTLDDSLIGYACKCGKIFDTMSKIKKHHAKSYIKRRKKQLNNYVLENYGIVSNKIIEKHFNQNLVHLGRVT